jgi:hypothetical protein
LYKRNKGHIIRHIGDVIIANEINIDKTMKNINIVIKLYIDFINFQILLKKSLISDIYIILFYLLITSPKYLSVNFIKT